MQSNPDLGSLVDSPYGIDFGNDHFGLHFQDGTNEQDVSLSNLLDEVFNNHDEFSCEESKGQKELAIETNMQSPGEIYMSQTISPENFHVKDNSTFSVTDTDMAQVQVTTNFQ